MRKALTVAGFVPVLVLALALVPARAAWAGVGFRPVDIYVDSGETKLAAYQVEVRYDNSRVKIVGLEGGETRAFRPAPFYDPAGLEAGRIVIAAFVSEDVDLEEAPAGRTRVARLHLHVGMETDDGAPDVAVALVVAADTEGRRIVARAELVQYEEPEREEEKEEAKDE